MRAYNLAIEYYDRLRWKEAIPMFEKVINNEKSKTLKVKLPKQSRKTTIYERSSFFYTRIKGIGGDK